MLVSFVTNFNTGVVFKVGRSSSVEHLRGLIAEHHAIEHMQHGMVSCTNVQVFSKHFLLPRCVLRDNLLVSDVVEALQTPACLDCYAVLQHNEFVQPGLQPAQTTAHSHNDGANDDDIGGQPGLEANAPIIEDPMQAPQAQPSSRAKTQGVVPTSAQQPPQQHPAEVPPQQAAACEQAGAKSGGHRQHSSFQVVHNSKQLYSKQAPADGPGRNSRAAQAASRALKKPTSDGGSDKKSDAEQLTLRPMPKSLHHRELQSNLQHKAHKRQQSMVKLNSHEAVNVDLPAAQPSSSAVVQTATRSSGAFPQPTHQPLQAGSSLRCSARQQQSAQPAAQDVIMEAVNNAGAQASTTQAGVAVSMAASTATATAQLQGQDQPCKQKETKEKATAGAATAAEVNTAVGHTAAGATICAGGGLPAAVTANQVAAIAADASPPLCVQPALEIKESKSRDKIFQSGVTVTPGVNAAIHHARAEATTAADEERPAAGTSAQAASTAAEASVVPQDAEPLLGPDGTADDGAGPAPAPAPAPAAGEANGAALGQAGSEKTNGQSHAFDGLLPAGTPSSPSHPSSSLSSSSSSASSSSSDEEEVGPTQFNAGSLTAEAATQPSAKSSISSADTDEGEEVQAAQEGAGTYGADVEGQPDSQHGLIANQLLGSEQQAQGEASGAEQGACTSAADSDSKEARNRKRKKGGVAGSSAVDPDAEAMDPSKRSSKKHKRACADSDGDAGQSTQAHTSAAPALTLPALDDTGSEPHSCEEDLSSSSLNSCDVSYMDELPRFELCAAAQEPHDGESPVGPATQSPCAATHQAAVSSSSESAEEQVPGRARRLPMPTHSHSVNCENESDSDGTSKLANRKSPMNTDPLVEEESSNEEESESKESATMDEGSSEGEHESEESTVEEHATQEDEGEDEDEDEKEASSEEEDEDMSEGEETQAEGNIEESEEEEHPETHEEEAEEEGEEEECQMTDEEEEMVEEDREDVKDEDSEEGEEDEDEGEDEKSSGEEDEDMSEEEETQAEGDITESEEEECQETHAEEVEESKEEECQKPEEVEEEREEAKDEVSEEREMVHGGESQSRESQDGVDEEEKGCQQDEQQVQDGDAGGEGTNEEVKEEVVGKAEDEASDEGEGRIGSEGTGGDDLSSCGGIAAGNKTSSGDPLCGGALLDSGSPPSHHLDLPTTQGVDTGGGAVSHKRSSELVETEVLPMEESAAQAQALSEQQVKAAADAKIIYASPFEYNVKSEDVEAVFQQYGKVDFVRKRVHPDVERTFNGSVFVGFADASTAEKVVKINIEHAGAPLRLEPKIAYMTRLYEKRGLAQQC